ncbi:unnamed protein product [Protopolystoma xenopodis]|uniref:Uncharacterized protein n=1 Tax=Protopolystoma xenopodis TaxID=117903 RepID=A0A3S5BIL0_9PLAT|nr:unnamed protein product [Protopolystoma xenopodis]
MFLVFSDYQECHLTPRVEGLLSELSIRLQSHQFTTYLHFVHQLLSGLVNIVFTECDSSHSTPPLTPGSMDSIQGVSSRSSPLIGSLTEVSCARDVYARILPWLQDRISRLTPPTPTKWPCESIVHIRENS